ncbi:MAG: hypothetical protein IJ467_08290 [Bacteroidaceae bacterium]|nr:hypothetical protein [Bacteroidaceae bacterium]
MYKKLLFGGILALLPFYTVKGERKLQLSYAVESRITANDGDYAPFWFTANRQGLSSIASSHGYLRGSLFGQGKIGRNTLWKYQFGVDLATGYDLTSDFIVHQAFADISYGALELSIGSKERFSELKNRLLSSGGMTYSGNSRPIPQVRISLPEFWTIPGVNWLHVKGHLAYGRFTDDNWQRDFTSGTTSRYGEDILYHSKAAFFKFGNPEKFPVELTIGAEMMTQFGGTVYNTGNGTQKMPSSFKDYFKVLLPFSGDSSTPAAEQNNVYGNTLGSWHIALDIHLGEWHIRPYYEHFFDDQSMIVDEISWKEYGDNFGHGSFWDYIPPLIPDDYYWKDGLYGIEVTFPKNRIISQVLYEYVATKEQTGPLFHDNSTHFDDQISAVDNYFNHYIYPGWQHWGMSIGTPLVLSPIYNENKHLIFRSNRMKAHHIALTGSPTNEFDYRILCTFTDNWGTYYDPLDEIMSEVRTLAEINYSPSKLKGWNFTLSGAWDYSELTGHGAGAAITITKKGILCK